MAFEWTDDNTAEVKAVYLGKIEELMEANPDTQESDHSAEALAEAAEAVGTSAASARIKLTKMGAYIKVTPKKTASAPKEGGSKRVGKAEAQGELVSAFKDGGVEDLDMAIVEKLTGKAALHLAEKVRELSK